VLSSSKCAQTQSLDNYLHYYRTLSVKNELRRARESDPLISKKYIENFDYVWNWKVSIEEAGNSILDDKHFSEAFWRLSKILPKWQTYRNAENSMPYQTLKESLQNIIETYNEIRAYSLLEFRDIPEKMLRFIWHELGRVKEFEGRTNDNGYYYAIAACKPLLLIWGQTPAFDSKVRENLPGDYGIKKYDFRFSYKRWYEAMTMMSDDLQRRSECIATMENISHNRYGANKPVPYGRYLDIYYWKGK